MANKIEIPAWVESTPEDNEYQLAMFREGGSIEFIEVARDEYIALKAHLAVMRGHVQPTAVAAAA